MPSLASRKGRLAARSALVVVAAALASAGCATAAPNDEHVATAAQRAQTSTMVLAADGTFDDVFGYAVGISGGSVLVGAPGKNALYRFEHAGSSWSQADEFIPTDATGFNRFGDSVKVSGDVVAVSAPVDLGFQETGVVYVLQRSGAAFSQVAEVTAASGADPTHFGRWIALANGTLAAWSTEGTQVFVGAGAAWTYEATLVPSVAGATAEKLAIDGDTLVAAVPTEVVTDGSNMLDGAGAVYVFTRTAGAWSEQARLVDPEPETHAFFGESIAIEGDRLLVARGGFQGLGRVREFARAGGVWTLESSIAPSSTGFGFGQDLSMQGDLALVANNDDGVSMFARTVDAGGTTTSWTEQFVSRGGVTLGWENKTFAVGRPSDGNDTGSAVIVDYSGALAGAACANGDACVSGSCVGGVCCNASCNSGCEVCTVADGASADGVCTRLDPPACCSSDAECDDGDACTSDTCNNGKCKHANACCQSAAECDHGDPCEVPRCVGGLCQNGQVTGGDCGQGGGSSATGTTDGGGGGGGDGGGCGCEAPGSQAPGGALASLGLALLAALARRRRR